MVEYTPEAIIFMILYSAASSSLLLINKLCLRYVHAPSFISTLQFVAASIVPVALMATNLVPRDEWACDKLKAYSYYVGMFVCTIYCNMKVPLFLVYPGFVHAEACKVCAIAAQALEFSNVETIIVFRACVPLVVAILDWGFMGRQLPSLRSSLSLAILVQLHLMLATAPLPFVAPNPAAQPVGRDGLCAECSDLRPSARRPCRVGGWCCRLCCY